MANLTTLKLFLGDLLEKRAVDLHKSKAGKYFAPQFEAKKTAIDALPPALTGGAPMSAELEEGDGIHDGHGGVLWFVTEAALRKPNATKEVLDAARAIRAA